MIHENVIYAPEILGDPVELELLELLYQELATYPAIRATHNQSGYFADEIYSEDCLAAGHTQANHEHYLETGTHIHGHDGWLLCIETRFGSVCTTCQSENCAYREAGTNLWRTD